MFYMIVKKIYIKPVNILIKNGIVSFNEEKIVRLEKYLIVYMYHYCSADKHVENIINLKFSEFLLKCVRSLF